MNAVCTRVLVLLAVTASGCVDSGPAAVPAVGVLVINKAKVDPGVVVPFVLPSNEVAHPFDITGAVSSPGLDAKSLRYSWYYDYARNTGRPLDSYAVCAPAQERCVLYPCQHENALAGSHHRLMVVVSDLPLRVTDDSNRDMFDFPADAHFDAVQWDILIQGCPGS
jgi:hypothetical protein